MASVQEKNLSQDSREKSEKKLFFLEFHLHHLHDVVNDLVTHSVPFSLDYSEKPDILRVAFSPDICPPGFVYDLYDFYHPSPLIK